MVFSDYLELQRMPMVSELTVFCGAMVGASYRFPFGTTLIRRRSSWATWAVLRSEARLELLPLRIKQELLLPFIGGVFILEALSVMLQVGKLRACGMESASSRWLPCITTSSLLGWSESKVIARFWILALIFALLALTTLKLR